MNVLYETDASGNVVRSYVYGENGQLLAMKKGNATYFYHYNAHGDVIALTEAQGNIAARYQYDTWGKILSQLGDMAAENPYRYAGYQYDEETGLHYLIARYYHPTHGVFLSLDPDQGDADDILTQNGYTYANNNPVMLVDPDGHFVWMAINAGFAAYDGYKAFKKGGWKAAAIAVGVGLVGGAAFKGAKIAYRVYKARRALKGIGKVSSYKDITIGKSIPNRATNVTKNKFVRNLVNAGWKKSISKDGKAIILTKNGQRYSLRKKANSYGGWTANYSPNGKKDTLKIRLGAK